MANPCVYFVLSSAKCEGRLEESGRSDRPDIHRTAVLPFELRNKKIWEEKAARIKGGWSEFRLNWWALRLFVCKCCCLQSVLMLK